MTFQIGEKVVYPNQGVATVENISTRSFGTHLERFYLLRLSYNRLTVLVPFSHAEDVGLRKVTRNGEVDRVLTFLSTGACTRIRDWKNRFKMNSDKMRSGSLLETAEVLKCLLLRQREKALSFREKRMLDGARRMLITEISVSRGLTEARVIELLQRALAKAGLALPDPL